MIDKTQTVEHKCNCAFTKKGVVIKLKLRRILLNFDAKTWLELFHHSKMSLVKLKQLSCFIFLQIFNMKTLWTFSALVLATLYHGSLQQKPSSEYCNFDLFLLSQKKVTLNTWNHFNIFGTKIPIIWQTLQIF